LRKYGSDAVRYWAANGRLGADVTFDPAQLRVGRRLAIKILNASRFILGLAAPEANRGDPGDDGCEAVSEPLDAAMLDRLAGVIGQCTRALDGYDHTGALAAAEEFFWFFCDDYLELVKGRAYGERGEEPGRSARAALRLALSVILRLFAPFLPYVTEEVWSWWQDGSVHTAAWPTPGEVAPEPGPGQAEAAAARSAAVLSAAALSAASGAIAAIRGAKSAAQVSMRAPVRALVVTARQDHLDALLAVLRDVEAAGRVERTDLRRGDAEPAYQVTL
jgi:valyl-tRNA synthetase